MWLFSRSLGLEFACSNLLSSLLNFTLCPNVVSELPVIMMTTADLYRPVPTPWAAPDIVQ